jgi:MFS family permease
MTGNPAAPPPAAHGVVPLLALAAFLSYADRGNLSTAAPLMKDELGLTSTQIGLVISAFFWSYVPTQLLAGWLVERINAYRTLTLGLAIWALATASAGLAVGFPALLVLRILLGVGESALFPCIGKLLVQHAPPGRLGTANGWIGVGMAMGPALGTFLGGLMMARVGWRPVFFVFGLVSALWLVPWILATRRASAHAGAVAAHATPSFRRLLRRRELWGACLGQFCGNYALYFVISWLPLYLVKSRGLSVTTMAEISGVVYAVYAFCSFLTGRLADRWIQGGADPSRVRKVAIILAHGLMTASLLVAATGDITVAVASLVVAGVALGINTPTVYSIAQTLAGPRVAGQWIGVQNATANLAGIVAPIVTGLTVDRTGHYQWAFAIAAGVAATGIIGWGLLIRRVELLDWDGAVNRT